MELIFVLTLPNFKLISKMFRLAAIVATAAVAVQSSTIEEFQCTDGDCTDCIQLANITTGKCYDDPQEGDLFVVAGCDDTRLVEMFYSDDKCANASGKKQIEHFYIDQLSLFNYKNHSSTHNLCHPLELSLNTSIFVLVQRHLVSATHNQPNHILFPM